VSEFRKITYALADDVATITFNDPATMNACGMNTASELTEAFARAGSEARAVVLTGVGRGFCSGANLTSTQGAAAKANEDMADDGGFDAGASLDSHYNPLVTQLRDLPIPFVTAVNGAAAGIGCSIALLGDMIVAGESAYFLQAFRRIGLVPDGGSTYLLARAVGRSRAMEMMMLGEKVPAAQALAWGLVNRVVPDAKLADHARALALSLAQGPTRALSMIRKAAWTALDNDWGAQLQVERVLQRDAGRTEDFMEGVSAFLTKRPAAFTGR
jgi:2-(1,2-epoxy-1,2-dihydrophenyl)acetyl-CoA isomerase